MAEPRQSPAAEGGSEGAHVGAPARPRVGGGRGWGFRLAAMGFVVLVVLIVAELAFRVWETQRVGVQQIDPGFLSYDETLGWTLTPLWRGRHQYAGFDVAYAVDGDGFRVPPATPVRGLDGVGRRVVPVYGDSFTFGIGVGEGEPFADQATRLSTNGCRYLNRGVPGYSTDQELLLASRELKRWTSMGGQTGDVVLAVCLANDLLDNPRAFPIQGHLGKPRFVPGPGEALVLTNVPVPRLPKPPWSAADELASAMLGPDWKPDGFLRVTRRSALLQYLHREYWGMRGPEVVLNEQHQGELKLFWGLVERLRDECQSQHLRLHLLLVPGSAGVVHPDSVAGHYQRLIRDAVLGGAAAHQVRVIDPVPALVERVRTERARDYFLNDGHLSSRGHRVVAEALSRSVPGT